MNLRSLREPMRRFTFSTHHSGLTAAAGFCNRTNNTTPLLQLLINSKQAVTRAPSVKITTYQAYHGHSSTLGNLDNSHVSAIAHQDPSNTEDKQRNADFDPEQQDIASEPLPSQICGPQLVNTVIPIPSQRQPPELDISAVTLPNQ